MVFKHQMNSLENKQIHKTQQEKPPTYSWLIPLLQFEFTMIPAMIHCEFSAWGVPHIDLLDRESVSLSKGGFFNGHFKIPHRCLLTEPETQRGFTDLRWKVL